MFRLHKTASDSIVRFSFVKASDLIVMFLFFIHWFFNNLIKLSKIWYVNSSFFSIQNTSGYDCFWQFYSQQITRKKRRRDCRRVEWHKNTLPHITQIASNDKWLVAHRWTLLLFIPICYFLSTSHKCYPFVREKQFCEVRCSNQHVCTKNIRFARITGVSVTLTVDQIFLYQFADSF